MDKIREIYKAIIEETSYMDCVNQKVEHEISQLLKNEKESMTDWEYEEYRGKIYQILAVAEEETFLVGFRYAISLLLDGCKHNTSMKNLDDL